MAFPYDYALKVYTEPSVEPLSVAEAGTHLRTLGSIEEEVETALLESYIKAARIYCERFTGRAFVNRTLDLKVHRFDACFELPKPPLSSVTSITYTDEDGNSDTVSASVYTADTTSEPGRVYTAYDQDWPTDVRAIPHPITIRYVAGYGAAGSSVPEPIRHAMRMLVGHWFENREDVITGTMVSPCPRSVDDLLWPYRMEAL